MERWRRFEILCASIEAGRYPVNDVSEVGFGPAAAMTPHVADGSAKLRRAGAGTSTARLKQNLKASAQVREPQRLVSHDRVDLCACSDYGTARTRTQAMGHGDGAFDAICDVNVMCYVCDFTSLTDWAESPAEGRMLQGEGPAGIDPYEEVCAVLLWLMVVTPARGWAAALQGADRACGKIEVNRRADAWGGGRSMHMRTKHAHAHVPSAYAHDTYARTLTPGCGGGVLSGIRGTACVGEGRHVRLRRGTGRRCVLCACVDEHATGHTSPHIRLCMHT